MKIEKVETKIYKSEYKYIDVEAYTRIPWTQLFVIITTDEGTQGIGEAWWGLSVNPVKSAINDLLAPLLVGENPCRIEYLWHKMFRYAYRYGTEGVVLCGLSSIDLALWDLNSKRLGVPAADLLGGVVRDSLKAYASLPPLRSEELIRKQTERAVEAGFAGVKLHEVNLKIVEAAREAAPDGYPIMLDVNGRWTLREAEANAKRLAEFDILWLEEPIWPMQDHEVMLRLRERVKIPLAAGENEYKLQAFDSLMQSRAVDYVQPEITKIGGLSMAVKVSALADLHNIPICPHGFRIGPALYANIHWALTKMNMEWLEIPFLPEGFEFPSGVPMPKMVNGEVYIPEGSGLGVQDMKVR